MQRGRDGFTISELIFAVGILALLIAAAVPAVIAIRGSLHIRKLDDTAREIFLSAQNRLTSRHASGAPLVGQEGWISSQSLESAGHFLILYDPGSATVLEVYYGEAPLPGEKIKAYEYSGVTHEKERRAAGIGYYSGSGTERDEPLLPPVLTLENGNALTAAVTVPHAAEYAAAGVTLTLTVEELDPFGDPTGKAIAFLGGQTRYSPTTGELRLELDSLTPGGRFKDVCPGLSPGADIRVTAELKGERYLSSFSQAEGNSLYQSREREEVSIACARHLQNLSSGVSGATGECYAAQTGEILWPEGVSFSPIYHEGLSGYNGNGNRIVGLRIEPGAESGGQSGAGLFAYVEGAALENIRLEDPWVRGSAEYTGALAGIVRDCRVEGCQVYGAGGGIACAGDAGGLIGLAAGGYRIERSSASLPRIGSEKRGAYLGGLIGVTEVPAGFTGTVRESYADTGFMGGRKWDEAYGLQGEDGVIGSLIGCAGTSRGTNLVEDCYGLGWGRGELIGKVEGVCPQRHSYSILQSAEGGRYSVEGRRIASLAELKALNWAGWSVNGRGSAYHPEICGERYPYPKLELRHYGDWPVETVEGIGLTDEAGKEIRFVMAPSSAGETAFYAGPRSGGEAVPEPVAVAGRGEGLSAAEAEGAGERTKITLSFADAPGVTYVDLRAEDYSLRVVVVLYRAAVTLTGEDGKALGRADSDGGSRTGKLILHQNAIEGSLWGEVTVSPTLEEIAGALGGEAAEFAQWETLRGGDPSVTANGDPEAGSNVLAPVGGSYYPTAGPDGRLRVEGASSGTATVSARWAMDESLEAQCEVKVTGGPGP